MVSSLRNLGVSVQFARQPDGSGRAASKLKTGLAFAAMAGSLALAGCSADVTRFDFPVFSMNEQDGTTASLPKTTQNYAPDDQSPGYGGTPAPVTPNYDPSSGDSDSGGNYDRGVERGRSEAESPVVAPRQRAGLGARRDRREADRGGSGFPTAPGYGSGANEPAPLPSTDYAAHPAGRAAPGQTITVRSGDTLYGLSRRHGVSVSALMQANGLASPNIRVGQKLALPAAGRPVTARRQRKRTVRYVDDVARPAATTPAPVARDDRATGTYRIRPGDSLYRIARMHGARVEDLKRWNAINDPTKLKVGQVLRVPPLQGVAARPAGRTKPRTRLASRGGQTFADRSFDDPATAGRARSVRPPASGLTRDPARQSGGRADDQAGYAPASGGLSDGKFRWPVRGRIISGFGNLKTGVRNDGINIAVPPGTPVRAVENGVVAYAGSELKGYGKLILIRHNDKWVSAYAHNSTLKVKRGDKIRRGQVIANSGRSGSVDRPQVHFELRRGSKPVDPMLHLASR